MLDRVWCLDEKLIIPFKARAFLNPSARAAGGEKIDSKNIRKHRKRLAQLLPSDASFDYGEVVRDDIGKFLGSIENVVVDTKALPVIGGGLYSGTVTHGHEAGLAIIVGGATGAG